MQGPEANELMLLLIDLDGLKQVNDLYGHMRGDELICQVSRALQALAGTGNAVYRVGGDEFTVIAARQDEALLRAGLEAIETQLQENGFRETGISYGVSFGSSRHSPHEMYAQADRLMYQHKTSRRDTRSPGKTPDASAMPPSEIAVAG